MQGGGYPGNLTQEQIIALYEGETLTLEIQRWSRSLATSQVRIERGVPYHLTALFNKRKKGIQCPRVWVDTQPLILGGENVRDQIKTTSN